MIAEMTLERRKEERGKRLQWGRDQMIAEMSKRSLRSSTSRLQWGRDQMIAEMMSAGARRKSAFAPLQWGRDQMIAEMMQRTATSRPRLRRFNGAAIK